MGECGDWRNLPSWLEGLKVARRRVKGWQVEKMVRRANEKGMMGVVMDCVRRVEKTGVVLGNVRVAREVAWGAVLKAVQSGWSEQGVESGVKYVENVWEMLCDGRHKGVEDPKKRPEVVGVLMQMYAAKALLIQGGRDEGGTVEKWAGLMLRLWENAELTVDETDWSDANYKLLMWSPVWHGIKMARQVLGSESPLSKRLEIRLTQDLEPLLQKTQAILDAHAPQEGKRRGLKMYESLSQVPT